MLKTSKKIAIFILSFIVIFLTVFHSYYQSAHASIGDTIGGISDTISIIDALLTNTGTVVSHERIQQFYIVKQEAIDAIIFTENEDQTITFSEESVQLLKDLFEEYLQETPEAVDMLWLPVMNETQLKASWFYTTTDYYMTRSLFDSHNLLLLYRPSNINVGTPIYFDAADFVFCMSGTSFTDTQINAVSYLTSTFGSDTITGSTFKNINILNPNGSIRYLYYPLYHNGTEWIYFDSNPYMLNIKLALNPFFSGQYDSNNSRDHYYFAIASETSNIKFIPIFASANAYKDWITGQADYYQFDAGYKGGDVTINPNADYSQITDAIKDVMMQSSANGDNIEAMLSQMQAAFSKALAEISGTLGDIDDNTAASNSWLEQIYDKLCDLYDMIDLYHRGEPDLENNN